ncbi:hypothetical protein CEXT_249631 [Caerostris extrusa]|uniref:Uncharacterized protein n=1 Tax=Caerostris extrusa TaxID=172846 RepID=A0AAV4UHI8_CAEEX|nr:hypothetical protein CEXT_249631 [Caerostris extrusa]
MAVNNLTYIRIRTIVLQICFGSHRQPDCFVEVLEAFLLFGIPLWAINLHLKKGINHVHLLCLHGCCKTCLEDLRRDRPVSGSTNSFLSNDTVLKEWHHCEGRRIILFALAFGMGKSSGGERERGNHLIFYKSNQGELLRYINIA